jgi:hypothetical protein
MNKAILMKYAKPILKTLQICDGKITTVLKKKALTGTLEPNKRGRHTPHNKTDAISEEYVCNFIKSFPACVFFFFFSTGPRAYDPHAPQPVGLLSYPSVLDVPTFAASPPPRPCYPRDP